MTDKFRNAVHLHFRGNSYQAFHFFCRVTGPLGDDLHHRRRKIGVGVHRHVVERDGSGHSDETTTRAGLLAAAAARIERRDESFEPASSVLQRIGKLKKQAAVAHDSVSNGNVP